MWLSLGSDGSAACGGVKRPERVAAVGERRSRLVGKEITEHRNRKSACFCISYIINLIPTRMWLSLVERLLWEQDAAGSNPVIRTTQKELPLVGSSFCVFLCSIELRHLASNASAACFGPKHSALPVAEEAECFVCSGR